MRRTLAIVVALGCAVAMVRAQRATPSGEWRYYAGDASSTKYSPLDQITRANGRNLTLPDGRNLFLGSSGTGAPTS